MSPLNWCHFGAVSDSRNWSAPWVCFLVKGSTYFLFRFALQGSDLSQNSDTAVSSQRLDHIHRFLALQSCCYLNSQLYSHILGAACLSSDSAVVAYIRLSAAAPTHCTRPQETGFHWPFAQQIDTSLFLWFLENQGICCFCQPLASYGASRRCCACQRLETLCDLWLWLVCDGSSLSLQGLFPKQAHAVASSIAGSCRLKSCSRFSDSYPRTYPIYLKFCADDFQGSLLQCSHL